ncbi:MAG: hypothetical protein DRN09_04130 [Thermoplasmata archaeon]|nr:MAG: hypothetical protein DRN09_04130 [Thermoplasmata archaeon]
MAEAKLFVLPESRHSKEAQILLKNTGLPCKIIHLNTKELIAAAPFDLGIKKVPALYVNGHWYQGLKEVKEFIRQNNR